MLDLATAPDNDPGRAAERGDFTIAALAARFYRSASTIRGWCERGRFQDAYKLNGRDWRIPSASVDAFLAEQRGKQRVTQLDAWKAVRRAQRTLRR